MMAITSCTGLARITSEPVGQASEPDTFYYDEDSHLLYSVSNDKDTLHIKLKTNSRATMSKMMQGPRIYFDLKAQKQKELYVKYPMGGSELGGPAMKDPSKGGPAGASGRQTGQPGHEPGLSRMLRNISNDILYVKDGKARLLYSSLLQPADIRCELSMEGKDRLLYELSMPFDLICEGGLPAMDKLSIGIEMEAMERGDARGETDAGMGGSGDMRGGGRGGRSDEMGGRGGSMGGRAGGMSGQGPGGGNKQGMMNPVEIWFEVDLYRD